MSGINSNFLQRIIPKFLKWLASPEGEDFSSEQLKKEHFFKTYLSLNEVENIDEGVLRDLVHLLWSYEMWTNKDWLLNQMLQSGLLPIRIAFKTLLYSDEALAERFDQMKTIFQMGSATISEILAHHDPSRYAIYNKRAKFSLIKLGVSPNSFPKSAQITGSQYEEYLKLVKTVFEMAKQISPEISDLLQLDFLLYYISIYYEEKAIEQPEEKFEHNEIVSDILLLGDNLGFEIQKEFTVASGCRVDAVWKSRIANLGMITYAFEVHKSGSRDSAILNLQRIFNADPTVQKVIIVSTDKELERFKEEIATLSEDFRNSVGYFRVKDLEDALMHQEALKKTLESIGLMKKRMPI